MIECFILAMILFVLVMVNNNLVQLNDNIIKAAKDNKAAIEHLPDCMSDVIHDRLRNNL
jgi:YbbR domain-containing protein